MRLKQILQDVLTFLPLIASFFWATTGSMFRMSHPAMPNCDGAMIGGAFGSLSVVIGIYIVLFERPRPYWYRRAWHRFLVGAIVWAGGAAAAIWNVSTAQP